MPDGFDLVEMLIAVAVALLGGYGVVRGYRRRAKKPLSVDTAKFKRHSEVTPNTAGRLEREHGETDAEIRESDARAAAPANGVRVPGSSADAVDAGREWLNAEPDD